MAGAREALEALAGVYRVVAVVSGRRSEDVAGLLGADGVRYEGSYGMQGPAPGIDDTLLSRAREVAGDVSGAWVEDKGTSIAVHYRQAADATDARARLLSGLRGDARRAGLEVVEGKMVLDLVPAGLPLKGGAVERLVREHGLDAVLYAGDDLADLDAFGRLDRLAAGGLAAVKVAVRGEETPEALLAAADEVVQGPEGLVSLLRQLV